MSVRENEARQRACDIMIAIQNAPAHKFGEILFRGIKKAVRETHEACAVTVEEMTDVYEAPEIAAAIRARGAS